MTISPISLGNVFTNGSGATVLGGLSSGLNTQAVINGIVAAQSSQITPLQDQVTVNNNQASALNTLQQLLTSIQTAAATLATPQSPDPTNNIWAVNTSNFTSNTSQDASNYITADVASGTAAGTYTISNITSIASNTTQLMTTQFSSASSSVTVASGANGTSGGGYFNAGTIQITGPGGTGTVTLNSGDTLTQVAADFNAATSQTGIQATVLQTSAGVYQLSFSSTTTGTGSLFDFTNTAASTVGTESNNSLGEVSFQTMVSGPTGNEGQNASFTYDGATITRSTNTISDLIPGVTLNLLQNTSSQSGASFTLQIAPDSSTIESGITAFANAYNSFLTFYAQQTQLNSSGTPASSAVLYSDTTLRTIYNQLTEEAATLVQGLSTSAPNTLSAIGISFANTPATSTTPQVDNTLSIDSASLLSSLQSNFSAVENIFGSNLTATASGGGTLSDIALFQSPTTAGVTSFTLNVNQSGTSTATYIDPTSGQSTTINLTSSSLNGSGLLLSVPAGDGALSGMQLIYGSAANASGVTVNLSQGVADQMNNAITQALTPDTGLLATDQTALQTKNTSINTQITTITSQVATTRQQLLQKFAALEAAINSANSSLDLLNAQQLAGSSS